METKNFIIYDDTKPIMRVPIRKDATIGQIKTYFIEFLKRNNLNPNSYEILLYIIPESYVRIDNNKKIEKQTLEYYWNKIEKGYIRLKPRLSDITILLENLPKDILFKIIIDYEIKSIVNLCKTSKILNDKICKNDDF